ncbi:MAG: LPS export ABC transporter permease LptF [Desulfuromonadaceae bacterium]|nr:LPS export ABC transporter permease LptF [Geobacteraceae bacterium]
MSAFRIQTYIAREVVVNFLLSLTLFTFIVLLSRLLKLTDLVIGSGVSLGSVARLFLAMMPSFMLITMPLSFLLAVLLTFARMSADSEIVAMKACGISVYKMARPVIILSLFVCSATAYLSTYAEPTGRRTMRDIAINVAMDKASSAVREQVFNNEFPGLTIFADKVFKDTNQLEGVFISDTRIDANQTIITATSGKLVTDKASNTLLLHLKDGAIHRDTDNAQKDGLQIINFSTYDINISMENSAAQASGTTLRPKLQTLFQLFNSLEKSSDPQEQQKRRELRAEIHERLIMPLSPILFSLIAIPLGISSHRSNKGAGFALSLAVFMIYYMFLSIAKTLVIEQGWPTSVTMWTPSIGFAVCGSFFLITCAKERSFNPISSGFSYLKRLGKKT